MEPTNCRKSGLSDKPQGEDLEALEDAMPSRGFARCYLLVAALLLVAMHVLIWRML
jgi:hypothetical protein